MTDDLDDLFEPAVEILYGAPKALGRYNYPPPPGEKYPPRMKSWMRMTNLASAFSDQKALQTWLTWKHMMGLRASDGLLFEEWMAQRVDHLAPDDQRAVANEYAERARAAVGADEGSRIGSAQHAVNEVYLNTGEMIGTRTQKARLESALEALDAADLELLPDSAEEPVWHPIAGGVMGTRDARVMCRRTGQIGTFDWKTQIRFWTYQEVSGQMYGYDSAKWRWTGPPNDDGRWVPNEPGTLLGHPDGPFAGKPVALVAHMPRDDTRTTLMEVDLTYGKAVLETAAVNVHLRSIGRSVAAARCPAGERAVWGVDTPAIAG